MSPTDFAARHADAIASAEVQDRPGGQWLSFVGHDGFAVRIPVQGRWQDNPEIRETAYEPAFKHLWNRANPRPHPGKDPEGFARWWDAWKNSSAFSHAS